MSPKAELATSKMHDLVKTHSKNSCKGLVPNKAVLPSSYYETKADILYLSLGLVETHGDLPFCFDPKAKKAFCRFSWKSWSFILIVCNCMEGGLLDRPVLRHADSLPITLFRSICYWIKFTLHY